MRNIILFLVLLSNMISAQTTDTLFVNANNLYKQDKYKEALALYKKIEATNEVSSPLYFNIANCYYKLNKVAPSIYNYEMALALDPSNHDAANNLTIAHKLTLDRIEPLPKTLFQKFTNNFSEKLHYNSWAYISVSLSIIVSVLFTLFYLSYNSRKKRFYFTSSILAFFLLIVSLAAAYQQFILFKNKKEAIIFEGKVDIKNAPTASSDDIFVLHEGTKVSILDSVDDWKKIRLIDGKIGWIKTESIKVINNF